MTLAYSNNSGAMVISIKNLGAYIVNEIEFVGPEYQTISSEGAVKPDFQWYCEDKNQHIHMWARDGKSILNAYKRQETVKCDGSCGNWDCEGWARWAWNCRLCGALIEPGYVPFRYHHVKMAEGYMVLSVKTDGAMIHTLKDQFVASATLFVHGKEIQGTVYVLGDVLNTYRRASIPVEYTAKVRFETNVETAC